MFEYIPVDFPAPFSPTTMTNCLGYILKFIFVKMYFSKFMGAWKVILRISSNGTSASGDSCDVQHL